MDTSRPPDGRIRRSAFTLTPSRRRSGVWRPQDTILTYGINYGILRRMKPARKITVHIPGDLLQQAQKSTGRGITETVRRGLQLVAAGEAYRQLRAMRGKVRVRVDLKALREDRS